MRTLRLDLDEIQVDRFDTGPAEMENGTFQAMDLWSVNGSCPPEESCNTNSQQRCRCQ